MTDIVNSRTDLGEVHTGDGAVFHGGQFVTTEVRADGRVVLTAQVFPDSELSTDLAVVIHCARLACPIILEGVLRQEGL